MSSFIDPTRSPALLECVLVPTMEDGRGDPEMVTPFKPKEPRGYESGKQGTGTAYGILLRDVPGTNGARKTAVMSSLNWSSCSARIKAAPVLIEHQPHR